MKSNVGAGIALHALPPHIADCIELKSPLEWRQHTAYKICFEVEDILAHRARILARGGQAKEPWEWERTRFCECTDLEGNVIQIFTPPQADMPLKLLQCKRMKRLFAVLIALLITTPSYGLEREAVSAVSGFGPV